MTNKKHTRRSLYHRARRNPRTGIRSRSRIPRCSRGVKGTKRALYYCRHSSRILANSRAMSIYNLRSPPASFTVKRFLRGRRISSLEILPSRHVMQWRDSIRRLIVNLIRAFRWINPNYACTKEGPRFPRSRVSLAVRIIVHAGPDEETGPSLIPRKHLKSLAH